MSDSDNNSIPTQRVRYPEKIQSKMKKEFPVLIGVPVPSIDHKINSGLSTFIAAAASRRIAMQWNPGGYGGISIPDGRFAKCVRNLIIDDFLHNRHYKDFDYLLFMDHDCHPDEALSIERMMSMNKDVVAGITPIMFNLYGKDNIWFNVQREDGKNMNLFEMPHEPFKALRVGGTCMLIKRHVLEAMEPPYQMDIFDEKHISFVTSEDYYFCDKIRANEFDIWADPHILNHHYHNVDLMALVMMIHEHVQAGIQGAMSQVNPELAATKATILEMAGKE